LVLWFIYARLCKEKKEPVKRQSCHNVVSVDNVSVSCEGTPLNIMRV